jgi:hypothetical protein
VVVVVVEGAEVGVMGQEMVLDGDLDQALGMGRLVGHPVQFTLVEAAGEGVVEEDKMVGLGMVLDPVLATAKLVGMRLMVAHTLRQEGKVVAEVAAVDNMGVPDPVLAQALGMVKPVGMGCTVVSTLREVDKVEVVAVDKMVVLEVGLVLVQDTVKLVGTGNTMLGMLRAAAKVEEVVVAKMAGLDMVLVQAQDMVKLVATVLTMVVDMLMPMAKVVAVVVGKAVQVAVDLETALEVALGLQMQVGTHET